MDSPLERRSTDEEEEDPSFVQIHKSPIIQKLSLLKALEFAISRNSVSITVLKLFELLEELEHHQLGGLQTPPSHSMKHAYAASAVKITVQHNTSDLEYFQTVKTLWRRRIGSMMKLGGRQGLGSQELWAWKDEIEASVWEDSLAETVVKKSESINAVEAVRTYLREERDKMKMGPSFLQLVHNTTDPNDGVPHCRQVNKVVEPQPDPKEPVQLPKTVSNISRRKGDVGIHHASPRKTSNVTRPTCLMERTITAHTNQWNESIDGSQEGPSNCGSRVELPRLRKRPAVSPLNKCETGSSKQKRRIRKWSSVEENTLRTGVEKYGQGNWKDIFKAYEDIFLKRTYVNLKDKWRNLSSPKKHQKILI